MREGTLILSATQAGDLFDHSLVKLRAEGQFGFAVRSPMKLSVVNLAA